MIPLESPLLDENLLNWSLQSLADSGTQSLTLVLHDVDQMSLPAQTFLAERIARWPHEWRIIATSASVPVDEESPAPLDPRLFHWFSTLTIDLPPLAARLEDLPQVTQYLVERLNAGGGKQVAGFSPAALDRMHLFDWPGGILQLSEAVAAAHAAARGPEIAPADLPPLLTHAETAVAFPREDVQPIVLEEVLAKIEVDLIRQALEAARGNKTQAATLLGMKRPKFYRRLEQLGLDDERQIASDE